ncbi:hypothetical protein Cpir12675_003772 [Ceratocystis pirilliformis]|uniref:Uncharacterized protein n=1 Tax=Ceratocystis pirilliformis TaxID=259994 RepID=A0ABR3Z0G9_9PEZI
MPSQRYYYSDCSAYDSPRGSPNVEYEQQQREDRELRRLARKEKARNKAEIEEYERIDCEMYEAEKSWAEKEREKEKEKDRQDRERRRRHRAGKQKLDKVIEKEVEKKVNAILTASLPQQPPHAASPCSPYGSSPSNAIYTAMASGLTGFAPHNPNIPQGFPGSFPQRPPVFSHDPFPLSGTPEAHLPHSCPMTAHARSNDQQKAFQHEKRTHHGPPPPVPTAPTSEDEGRRTTQRKDRTSRHSRRHRNRVEEHIEEISTRLNSTKLYDPNPTYSDGLDSDEESQKRMLLLA